MSERRPNERQEKRMRREWLRLEFRMKLASEEPGMLRCFDDLHVFTIGRTAGDAETGIGQRFFVLAIEFVAVTVALGNVGCAVRALRG